MKQWDRKLWMVIGFVSFFSGCSLAEVKDLQAVRSGSEIVFSAQFSPQHSHQQVFIDADGDTSTGYPVGGIGADYLIEDDWFYRYQGKGWRWDFIAEVPMSHNNGQSLWRVPAEFISPAGPLSIIFSGIDDWDAPELSSVIRSGEAGLVSHALTPYQMRTRRGSESDQGLDALASKDQSGTQDKWDDYIEFYPGDKGYAGQFYLRLPKEVKTGDIVRLKVVTNYRGERKKYQRWIWKIYDFKASRWQIIGDNSRAPNWHWKSFTFPVNGTPSHYFGSNGLAKLRYETSKDVDNSQLDLLKLVVDSISPRKREEGSYPSQPGNPNADGDQSKPPRLPKSPEESVRWIPKPGAAWQWQLSGKIDTSVDADIFDVDLFDTPQETIDLLHAKGRKVVCYFSAGTYENWRPDKSKFPDDVIGRRLDDWEGESWLDIRQIDRLRPIMAARMDLAKEKHCDGVEPDNVDGYDNKTGFPLKAEDQIHFNRMLAEEAHKRGLSIALKNALGLIEVLEGHFDWALNEQCFQYDECEMLQPFLDAGKAVLGVSYVSKGKAGKICREANQMGFSWLIKRWDLDAWRMDCRDYD